MDATHRNGLMILFTVSVICIPIGLVLWLPFLAGSTAPDEMSSLQQSAGTGLFMFGFTFLLVAWYYATGKPRDFPVFFAALGTVLLVAQAIFAGSFQAAIGASSRLIVAFVGEAFILSGIITASDVKKVPRRAPSSSSANLDKD